MVRLDQIFVEVLTKFFIPRSFAIVLANDLSKSVFKILGQDYSVDISYIVDDSVQYDFNRCIRVAIKAFLDYIYSNEEFKDKENKQLLSQYLKIPDIAREIGHLLEPGSEIFDRGKITQFAREIWKNEFDDRIEQLIFYAWSEFIKAFSFASRSAPHLREFLRASYEAGSFRTLSNIEDVLEKMDTTIKIVKNEEIAIKSSLDEYMEELKSYREWAINFATK